MTTLSEFLLARIAEDEANGADCDGGSGCRVSDAMVDRRLAECEAKRRLIAMHEDAWDEGLPDIPREHVCLTCGDAEYYSIAWPCLTIRVLAVPYADHPDYDQAWAL